MGEDRMGEDCIPYYFVEWRRFGRQMQLRLHNPWESAMVAKQPRLGNRYR